MRSYAALTFLSALLLFMVQPLMARAALPWFGGAASVWATSLLFYQTLLFCGYAYAHLGRRLGMRRQALLHLSLVGLSLLLLPVTLAEAWKPTGPDSPTFRLLGLLTASVGLPYLLLAGTTPLLHDWFGRSEPGRSPYRLYAVSNAGSLLALLAYPTLVEPFMAVRSQGVAWSWAYGGLALGLGWLVWRIAPARGSSLAEAMPPAAAASAVPPSVGERLFWTSLAACGTGLLMAITNTITMDVASVPLLWVVPLALYLTTFILAFGGAYRRSTWGAFLVLGLGATAVLWAGGFALPVLVQILLGCGILFAGCMVCHGELARTAPDAEYLTAFYLTMAGGGALGGLAVAIVAPAVLGDFYEFPGFVLLAYALLLVAMWRDPGSVLRGRGASLAGVVLVSVGVLAAAGFVLPTLRTMDGTLAVERNFYGVLRVQDRPAGLLSEMRVMRHGRIFHGAQYLDAGRAGQPTAYFTAGSGAARAIRSHPRRASGEPLRVGVIGLGVGTLAVWSRPGDAFRFYEINPAAERLAREYFTFLDGAQAEVEVVLGDGRIMLERELATAVGRPGFDVLIVDAFSGDAVPVHLLTLESLQVYRRALAPDGVLVLQITNRHVDLERVVRGLAEATGLQALRLDHVPLENTGGIRSAWMWLAPPGTPPPEGPDATRSTAAASVLWTDDFSNLIGVLR
ncbi:MAG: fused MFS/spermidine synthase [Deltaproteobacteria bacterium]|nr:fused MFS/spermidine synthase [Deltaproteobacteria bacterium]